MAEVLRSLGSTHVMVVHAHDGLDELSIAQPTSVAELKDDVLREYVLEPEDAGVQRRDLDGLAVDSAGDSAALIRSALGERNTPAAEKAADMIALNAGAGCYVAGLTGSR